MAWNSNWIGRVGLGLMFTAAVSAASAEVLVVRASGPSASRYRQGMMFADSQRVSLVANDSLTLLGEAGTWTLRGPGSFGVAEAPRAGARALAPTNGRRERVGAVRTVGGASLARPNLWMVDVSQAGAVCIADASAPILWRPEAEAAATTTLTGPDGSSAPLDWAPGSDTLAWPGNVPVVDGGAYRLTGADGSAVAFTLKVLPQAPTTAAEAGKALMDHQCTVQMEVMLTQLSPEPAGG